MIENVAMNTEEDIISKLEGVKTNFGRPRFVEDFVLIGEINHSYVTPSYYKIKYILTILF